MRHWFAGLLMAFSMALHAGGIEVHRFDDPNQEALYKKLIHELRCLVCQNQPISDSNAELAQDMRRKTYELVRAGQNEHEVTEYMRQRYGDFVTYKPPFNTRTAFLWGGPFVLLVIALWLMLRTIRNRRADDEVSTLDQTKLQQAAELLKQKSDHD